MSAPGGSAPGGVDGEPPGMATAAGGTHPTGMHSCSTNPNAYKRIHFFPKGLMYIFVRILGTKMIFFAFFKYCPMHLNKMPTLLTLCITGKLEYEFTVLRSRPALNGLVVIPCLCSTSK